MTPGGDERRPLLIRLARLLLVAGVAAFAVAPLRVNDLFWHVVAGRWFLSHRALPAEDPFTTGAPGKHWVCHEWASEIVLAAIDRLGGLAALRLTRVALLVSALLALRAFVVRRTKRPTIEIFALVAVWLLWQPHATLRPHVFGWLFALGYVALLSSPLPLSRGRLAAMFALVAVWMNFHTSGLIAIALAGAFLVGRAIEGRIARAHGADGADGAQERATLASLVSAVAVTTAATLVQPEGWRIFAYLFHTRDVARGLLPEWLPILRADTFEDVPRWPLTYLAVSLAFVVAAIARLRRRAPPSRFPGVLPSLMAIVTTADARRMSFLMFLPVLFVVEELSDAFDRRPPRLFARPEQAWVPHLGALAAALVAWAVMLPDWALTRAHLLPGYAPEAALDFAKRARLEGKMFNPYMWGGFVEYRLWPAQKAFIDGRSDLFGRALVAQTFAIESGQPGADAAYEAQGIDWSLLETHAFLEGAPLDPSRWALAYGDATAVVLLRRGPRFDENVRRVCETYASGAFAPELATFRLEHPRPQARMPSALALCAR